MRTPLALTLLLTTALACQASAPRAEPDIDAAKQRARAMVASFAGELQASLADAIQAGGPAHAIDVCKLDAPRITAAQAVDGWTLRRTALRLRNPANAPTDWEREVLEDWAAQGDDITTLELAEIVETATGPELRYMKAIPLGGVCLTCHGPLEQIDAEVQASLREQYPDDQATGFRVGELRGAFVVTGPLSQPG